MVGRILVLEYHQGPQPPIKEKKITNSEKCLYRAVTEVTMVPIFAYESVLQSFFAPEIHRVEVLVEG